MRNASSHFSLKPTIRHRCRVAARTPTNLAFLTLTPPSALPSPPPAETAALQPPAASPADSASLLSPTPTCVSSTYSAVSSSRLFTSRPLRDASPTDCRGAVSSRVANTWLLTNSSSSAAGHAGSLRETNLHPPQRRLQKPFVQSPQRPQGFLRLRVISPRNAHGVRVRRHAATQQKLQKRPEVLIRLSQRRRNALSAQQTLLRHPQVKRPPPWSSSAATPAASSEAAAPAGAEAPSRPRDPAATATATAEAPAASRKVPISPDDCDDTTRKRRSSARSRSETALWTRRETPSSRRRSMAGGSGKVCRSRLRWASAGRSAGGAREERSSARRK